MHALTNIYKNIIWHFQFLALHENYFEQNVTLGIDFDLFGNFYIYFIFLFFVCRHNFDFLKKLPETAMIEKYKASEELRRIHFLTSKNILDIKRTIPGLNH